MMFEPCLNAENTRPSSIFDNLVEPPFVTCDEPMASDDAFSDLTDLEDELLSDEDYGKSNKRAKGKAKGKSKAKDGEYRIRHSLRTPRATTYSTESLFKQIDNGDIDLEPDYQREVVWGEGKQIKIIDSIFRNFYVPPVIFAVNTLEDGTEKRTCIDGKQRLTSIHRFMQGLIPHRDSHTNEKLWYTDNPEHRTRGEKRVLPDNYRRLFDTKAVVCVEYIDLTEKDEREIFQRVQLGVALTPAEKLKVLSTPRANFVRQLQETFLNNDESSLSEGSLSWKRSRGSDWRCVAQMLQSIHSGKQSSFSTLEKWLSDPVAVDKSFSSAIENTFHVYEALAAQESVLDKIAPIEFIGVGILLHKFRNSLTVAGLGKAVKAMRQELRVVTDDIRNNSRLQRAITTFLDKYKVPALGRGEVCAADSVKNNGSKLSGQGGSSSKATGAKRKMSADDEGGEEADSDDDYVPARKARATKAKTAPTPRKRANVAAPISANGSSAAPPPTPPATASPPASTFKVDDDILKLAQQRINAARAHARVSTPASTPTSFSASAPPRDQTQHGKGAEGVAAALDANSALEGNLMWGSNGARIKTEPNPPPLSSGSNGSYARYESGSGRYSSSKYESRDRDRDRDRSRDRRDDYSGGRHHNRDYSGPRY
ncbi:hypothetical protein C8F01DRAFT_1132989 [Mycena amicta]|nr:hypothetical protein C8F01DRAFT_1132989 [Mycena amicta]